jgi:hypothetical protein
VIVVGIAAPFKLTLVKTNALNFAECPTLVAYPVDQTNALDARVDAWVLSHRSDPDTSAARLAGLYVKCLALTSAQTAAREGQFGHSRFSHEMSVRDRQPQRRYGRPELFLAGAAQGLVLGDVPNRGNIQDIEAAAAPSL